MLAAVFVADDVATAADPPRVTQSFVIDTNGNPEAVTGQAAKTRAIFKRLGIDARRRYFQATMAGASTGSLALAIEYPSLAGCAGEAGQRLGVAGLRRQAAGDGQIESNSLWVEVSPE